MLILSFPKVSGDKTVRVSTSVNNPSTTLLQIIPFNNVVDTMSTAEYEKKLKEASWKLKIRYNSINRAKEKKRPPLIDKNPIPEQTTCKAVTLSNKPCPFRAKCGNYCLRHAPPGTHA